jgi:hypothetical protein
MLFYRADSGGRDSCQVSVKRRGDGFDVSRVINNLQRSHSLDQAREQNLVIFQREHLDFRPVGILIS